MKKDPEALKIILKNIVIVIITTKPYESLYPKKINNTYKWLLTQTLETTVQD